MMTYDYTYGGSGEMNGVCTTPRCRVNKVQPKSNFFNKAQNRWVCFWCAQQDNAQAHRLGIRKPCISSRDRMLELLTA